MKTKIEIEQEIKEYKAEFEKAVYNRNTHLSNYYRGIIHGLQISLNMEVEN